MAKYYREGTDGESLLCWATGWKDKLAMWWDFLNCEKTYFVCAYDNEVPYSGYVIRGEPMREWRKKLLMDQHSD